MIMFHVNLQGCIYIWIHLVDFLCSSWMSVFFCDVFTLYHIVNHHLTHHLGEHFVRAFAKHRI